MSQEPSKRVLLMEDDEGLARLLERKLKGSGYQVDVADRQQALRVAGYFQQHYAEIVQCGQLRHLPGGM